MKKGLLSEAYPEKPSSKRIKSAPNVVVTPPQNLNADNTNSFIENKNSTIDDMDSKIIEMLQKPTSVSVSRKTNITLKALGSLGYGDTVDQTIELLVEILLNSFSVDEKETLERLIKSFKDFEIINFEKKQKNSNRMKK